MNSDAPNPFQPMVDAFAVGMSKLVAALLLGAMVSVVVMFAFRLALRGRPSTKLYREFSNLVARAAFGFSMLFFLYVGFVIMEPAKTGVSQSATAASDAMGSAVSSVLDEIDARWNETFRAGGQAYPEPRIVLFRNTTDGGQCGTVQTAMGPFYCGPDQRIFLDTAYFREVGSKIHGCSGNTCRAVVAFIIARQVGYHVQNLLGILPKVMQAQQTASKAESNALQMKMELQADCLSGVWFNREDTMRPGFIGKGGFDAALRTASALGDDTLQQASGLVAPDSFTHGSAVQRKQWFISGYQAGTVQACNTFAAGVL